MKNRRNFCVIIIFITIFSSSLGWSELIKRDDFQDQKTWWDWGARCTSFPSVLEGVAYLIQESASSSRQCGTYFWDGENIYEYYIATIRVRALTPMRPGSRGWGFWDYEPPFTPTTDDEADVCWFMTQYDPFDASQTWWRAGTRNGETWESNYADLDSIVDEDLASQAL